MLLLLAVIVALPLPSLARVGGGGVRVAIEGAPGPGPAEFNRVWVRKYGSDALGHVLILVPGSPAGHANFDVLAPWLVDRVPNLAVWTVDRREDGLEDGSAFELGDPDLSLSYYFLGGGFEPVGDEDAPFVRDWGATVALEDLRRVVLAARDGGRRGVILGGHSAGAVLASTYPVWDFAGSPGHRDLEGLVLIDGMQLGAFAKALADTPFATPWATVAEARAALEALAGQSPFGFASAPLPVPLWSIGVLIELACQYALVAPQQPATIGPALDILTQLGMVPAGVVPDVPLTNEALAGVLFSSGVFPALKVRVGQLAPSGTPRPWVNGPLATVPQVCTTFVREPGNGMAWYYPVRLEMDLLLGTPSLERTPVSDFLGLRPFHLADVDVPLYVFETSISEGGILPAARELIRHSRIERYRLESDHAMGHLDPLYDEPGRNGFVQTVIPFLREITVGAADSRP